MKTIKLAVFALSMMTLSGVSFGDVPNNFSHLTNPIDLTRIANPRLNLPNFRLPTSGILFENNCRADFQFKVYNPQTCAVTRVFVGQSDAPRLCAKLPRHLEPVNIWLDPNFTNTAAASNAANISKGVRRSMRGRLTEVNMVDREARVRMNECGKQGVARIFFNQQEVGQLRNRRAGQVVTVRGRFEAGNHRIGDQWVVTSPRLR